jgi:hypothetical protein
VPSTYVALTYHVVFTTWRREPWITPARKEPLYGYMGGIVSSFRGHCSRLAESPITSTFC